MRQNCPGLNNALRQTAAGLIFISAFCAATIAAAATITVNSVLDTAANDGVCTLREAITAANTDSASGALTGECAAGSGADQIVFSIPGAGSKLIATSSVLPAITTQIHINGYTQPGASPNSNPLTAGSNAVFMVEIDHGAVANSTTFMISGAGAANSIIEGLVLSRSANSGCCANSGIYVSGTSGVWIRGNLFGTDVTATTLKRFADRGVYIDNSTTGVIVGSSASALLPAHRNVFAGAGTAIGSSGTPNTLTVRGNLVGTTPSGAAVLSSSAVSIGIWIDNTIGASLVSDNVIAGASQQGMRVRFSNGAIIENNRVGVAVDGTSPLGNGAGGGIVVQDTNNVAFTNLIIRNNIIANNAGPGVTVLRSNAANTIRGIIMSQNRIHDNAGSEIDLTNSSPADGTTANDALDIDGGANNLQNYPVLSPAGGNGASVAVPYSLGSEPNQTFVLEFFHATSCDATGHGGSVTYLGSVNITTDGSGNAAGTANLASAVTSGVISATATHATNGTSEFSACAPVSLAAANVVLTVSKTGLGSGIVSGTGISCGADCTESVAPGTIIVLSATASPGSTFTGWSGGGCSGTSTCTVTVNTALEVTAQFGLVVVAQPLEPVSVPTLHQKLLAVLALIAMLIAAAAVRSLPPPRERD